MIKMMTGILTPSAGTLSVLGREPHANRTLNAREIGVVFGQRSQLWWDLPVRDSFALNRHIYDIPEVRFADNLALPNRHARHGAPISTAPSASSASASACAPKSRFPCCTIRKSSSSTNPPSASMSSPRMQSANSSPGQSRARHHHHPHHPRPGGYRGDLPPPHHGDDGKLLFDGELKHLRASLGSRRRLKLEFATDPGPLPLTTATLAVDEGAAKHYLLEDETISLIDVLNEIGRGHGLKDVKLEEPDIEEVIRTFYQNKTKLAGART
jgi:ABC-2 type transport system ATP-binding protein